MIDWETFWTVYPASVDEHDFLRQVGHTVGGTPYSRSEFEAMIASIRGALQLGPDDVLLDVCCGNGVVTTELAKHCARVVGIDFSAPLIDIARRFHGRDNVVYRRMNALAQDDEALATDGPFSRVLIYAALQHFGPEDLERLLTGLLKHASVSSVILLGAVLDSARKHLFLDTPEKRELYRTYRIEGRDRLGTWWDKDFVRQVCQRLGLPCVIDDSSPGRAGGHYRFDAVIPVPPR